MLRSNFISGMWKRALEPVAILPAISENGWNSYGEVEWISGESFPENISELLLDESGNVGDVEEYGTDCESDFDE